MKMNYKIHQRVESIFTKVTGLVPKSILQMIEQYGDGVDEIRYYDVFDVETENGHRILKKVSDRELFVYKTYLSEHDLPVPYYCGNYSEDGENWIVIEHIDGTDLRDMTDELAIASAECIAKVQNKYWDGTSNAESIKDDRFEIYRKRILKRAASIESDTKLYQAYQFFLDRQTSCPLTLSNGDFLQFNVINTAGKVTIIDWGFSGRMPYSLDIARFIAHATEDRATFPFYMNSHQKELFVKHVYKNLDNKPSYEQYVMDIKLAVLNEYIEFIEADEDDDKWYYNHAQELAANLLSHNS